MREAARLPNPMSNVNWQVDQTVLMRIFGMVAGYIMILTLARTMTSADFGWFSIGLSTIGTAAAVAGFGQPAALQRVMAAMSTIDRSNQFGSILRTSQAAAKLGALTIGIAIAALGEALRAPDIIASPPGLFMAIGSATCALALLEWECAVLQARSLIALALIPREIVWRLGLTVGALLCAFSGLAIEPVGIILALSLFMFVSIAIQKAASGDMNYSDAEALDGPGRRYLRKSARSLWMVALVSPLSLSAGTLVLAVTVSAEVAGLYLILDRASQLLAFVLMSMNAVVTPQMAHHCRTGDLDRLRLTFMTASLYAGVSALAGLTILIMFGQQLLGFVSSSSMEGYVLLLLLGIAQVINAAAGPARALLTVSGHEHLAVRLALIFGGLGLVLILLGGLFLGLVGVVIAAACATIVRSVVTFACCANVLGLTGFSRLLAQE